MNKEEGKPLHAPFIQTNRLTIKPLTMDDARAMFQYRSDERVRRYQTFQPRQQSEVDRFIRGYCYHPFGVAGTWFQLGIFLREPNTLIGDVGLGFLRDHKEILEMGYTVAPAQQRKGYATEAVSAIIEYLFEHMKITCVIAAADGHNTASIALLMKLKFSEISSKEASSLIEVFPDDRIFSLRKPE